jgi:hypothetical protein
MEEHGICIKLPSDAIIEGGDFSTASLFDDNKTQHQALSGV